MFLSFHLALTLTIILWVIALLGVHFTLRDGAKQRRESGITQKEFDDLTKEILAIAVFGPPAIILLWPLACFIAALCIIGVVCDLVPKLVSHVYYKEPQK